jgi:uncharacterized membrane protein
MLLVHLGTVRNEPELGVAAVALGLYALLSARFGRGARPLLALGIAGPALLLAASPNLAAATVGAVPVIVNASLFWFFGTTLLPGREPLIARYCRYEHGVVPPEFAPYTRAWTGIWTLLFAVFTLECALLMCLASPETWSLFANWINNAVVAALFLGEHLLRSVLFPQFGWASPLRTGRAILLASSAHD